MRRKTKALTLGLAASVCFLCGNSFAYADNIYVLNIGAAPGLGYIEKFDSSGNGSIFSANVNVPTGLAFDSSGNLYVTGDFAGREKIEKFNSSGQGTVFTTLGLDAPQAVA